MSYNNHRSFAPYGNYDIGINDRFSNQIPRCGPCGQLSGAACAGPTAGCAPLPCPPCGPNFINTCESQPLVYPFGPRRAVTTWKINYLVSNYENQAAHVDLALVNPWGIVVFNNQLYVSNGGTDSVTNYDLFGNKILGAISVRDASHNSSFPTGIAINCSGNFVASSGTTSRSSLFIVATEHGTVHSYNTLVDPVNSNIVMNHQLTGEVAVFRGVAITNNVLYIANFFQGVIDVFDGNYNRLLGYHFIDGDSVEPIPLDYGPNNIVHIGCFMYVLYARKDPNVTVNDLDGPGNGYISVFNLDGSWVKRFSSRGVLNSPWAMIPAPAECGFPPGSFLVGNNGDGRINIFDCAGRFVGPVLNQKGLPIHIEGLWGLAPRYTDFSEIFFASSKDENIDGLVGSITKDQVIYF